MWFCFLSYFLYFWRNFSIVMTQILNHTDITNKIRRIAYQIYETHIDEQTLILAGIDGNGYIFATLLAEQLRGISPLEVQLCKVSINKREPLAGSSASLPTEAYRNKAVVLVDDVLESGRTLMYGAKHFLEVPLKSLTTAVLVNRNHKQYPIKADFKGISLSTSLQEHITVEFDEGDYKAFLS